MLVAGRALILLAGGMRICPSYATHSEPPFSVLYIYMYTSHLEKSGTKTQLPDCLTWGRYIRTDHVRTPVGDCVTVGTSRWNEKCWFAVCLLPVMYDGLHYDVCG